MSRWPADRPPDAGRLVRDRLAVLDLKSTAALAALVWWFFWVGSPA